MKKNSNNSLISIIIPVYNVEKYITKCLQSLLDQTYKNFEAIIVDDGSLDNSIQIAKALVGDDHRFIFLEKENGGLSSARNFGLDHVTGDYIAFLDSDDYFIQGCLNKVMNEFEINGKVDIVLFGTLWVSETGEVLQKTTSDIAKYNVSKDILLYENSIEQMVCNKVYHRNVFVDERFCEGIIYEDTEIIPRLLLNKNLSCLPYYLYGYVQREGSITNKYNPLSISSTFFIFHSHKKFLEQIGKYDGYKIYYEKGYIWENCVNQTIKIYSMSDSIVQNLNELKKNMDYDICSMKHIMKQYGVFSKIFFMTSLFLVSPRLIFFIVKFRIRLKNIYNI